MSVIAADRGAAIAGPRIAIEPLRRALLWLLAFSGGFVFIEPSPYEFIGIPTLFLFAVTGLSLRPALTPLLLLLIMLNLGYAVSVMRVVEKSDAVMWVLISAFLAATAVFYAAILGANTEMRLRSLMRGYVAASVIVSLVATAAYFRLFGGFSDLFVVYDRARGTFKDPNVLGAFLVLPSLIMIQRMLVGRRSQALAAVLMLLVMMSGLLLSFSRAAWGQFVLGAMVLLWLIFVTSRSPRERVRIVLISAIAVFIAVVFVAALLSIHHVDVIFKERAALTQSYDIGPEGRFGRYWLGLRMLLDYPQGLGPLQFQFPEAPHNTFLNSFLSGGWIGGIAYATITLVTLALGLRYAFVATPWQPSYQIFYAAFVATVAESVIIDSDHWRHYFLILGVLWGLIAVSRPYLAAAHAPFSARARAKAA
jgi:O-Antigen ligase